MLSEEILYCISDLLAGFYFVQEWESTCYIWLIISILASDDESYFLAASLLRIQSLEQTRVILVMTAYTSRGPLCHCCCECFLCVASFSSHGVLVVASDSAGSLTTLAVNQYVCNPKAVLKVLQEGNLLINNFKLNVQEELQTGCNSMSL